MELAIYREYDGALERVGALTSADGEPPIFAYDGEYLSGERSGALSISLPLREMPYEPSEAQPYFEGLLPESGMRTRLAAALACREDDSFALLSGSGLDCAGDVIVNPSVYKDTRAYREIELAEAARQAKERAPESNLLAQSRMSLAGVQDKIGLYHDVSRPIEEGWHQPIGGAPSTHIIKLANEELPDLLVIESLCLSAARDCGIETAQAELMNPGNPVLCIERYDRLEHSGETIEDLPVPLRRHQEDLAQAFGMMPGSKYAEVGGDTISAVGRLIGEFSSHPALDIELFCRSLLFDFAIGNCDNHLKNTSLLYSRDWRTLHLAPVYDVPSTTYYARFSKLMGMRIGKARNIDEVAASDLLAAAESLQIREKALRRIAGEIADALVPSLRSHADELASRGFAEAGYVGDELEGDVTPRLDLLQQLTTY